MRSSTISSFHFELQGQLCDGRVPAVPAGEGPLGPAQPLQPLDDVYGQPYRPPLVGQRPRDGLPDPPGGVGAELVAAVRVEFLDGTHQAEVALLYQVQHGQGRGPGISWQR